MSLIEKVRLYYQEVIVGTILGVSLAYFAYSLHNHRQSVVFLSHAKSKILLMEARQKRAIEQKLNEAEEKSCKECFEAALAESGFKILKMEYKLNHISAHVSNNPAAKVKLLEILDGIQYIEDKESLEIRWFFNEKKSKEYTPFSDNSTNQPCLKNLLLGSICFFGDSSWQVWINGKMYDQTNRNVKLDNASLYIEKVSETSVVLKKGEEKIVLELS